MIAALRRRWWAVVLGLVVLTLALASRIANFYTDVLWFNSINFGEVFWSLLRTKVALAGVAGLALFALLAGNLLLARKLAPPFRMPAPGEENIERYRALLEPYSKWLLLALAAFIAVLSGLGVVNEWPRYLLWANATEFGIADPQFGRDLGWFAFVLPFHTMVNSWLFTSLALVIVLVALTHYLFGGIRPQSPGQKVTPQTNVHLSVLLAGLVAVRGWGFYLDQFLLSYSERGQVTGLSYTDVNAQLRAYQLLLVISVVCVGLFLANVWFRNFLLPAAGVGILLIAAVVLSGIYPAVIQRLQVDPQEGPREDEFIARNLELTRFAYGLDDVATEPFAALADLSDEEVVANSNTLESIRLWDPATLQSTYQQLQEFRPYYDFRDVDVDRYEIDGDTTQVMISVREISERDLPQIARTWQNSRLEYTHGFGLVSSAVSTSTEQGQPVFLVRDIPPSGVAELEVDNPRIYFGENSPTYSIVGTAMDELDFPRSGEATEPARFSYDGQDGVRVGGFLRRLAFGLKYAEPNFVLTNLIEPQSRILFNRNVRDRVEAVAPFLKLDHDPYPVAIDGRIKWVVDGYTTTDMIPYSQRSQLDELTPSQVTVLRQFQDANGQISVRQATITVPGLSGQANYIRNSIKAVVDAYDGTVTLYVADPKDPIIQTWEKIFPASFTPLSEAPEGFLDHLRYPEDMFRVQSEMFRTYHIPGAAAFYTKEDAWNIPLDAAFSNNQQDVAPDQRQRRSLPPYYQLMRLPGEEEESFALIQPFTPAQRENLTAWLAGRLDAEGNNQLKAYLMPQDRTVLGTEQVQAIINQDDDVAEQITLWNRAGSRVIYGNLLVVPIEDSLLYAQPLFLRAEQSDIPQLRKVVLVYDEQVYMTDTLAGSLAAVFGAVAPSVDVPIPEGDDQVLAPDGPGVVDGPGGGPGGGPGAGPPLDPAVRDLITRALGRFADGETALAQGDLGGYQSANADAEELLRQAQELIDQETAASPGAAEPPVATEPPPVTTDESPSPQPAGTGGAAGGAGGGAPSPTASASASPSG